MVENKSSGKKTNTQSSGRRKSAGKRKKASSGNSKKAAAPSDEPGKRKKQRPAVSGIAVKPLSAPITKDRKSIDELDAIDEARREVGRKLAEEIYRLTNEVREQDFGIYLDTINEASLDTCSEENQLILQTARDHFIDKYGDEIRARGRSSRIEDEIVHRTGKGTREAIEATFNGFDVTTLSQDIWILALERAENLHEEIARRMYPLTNRQVKELRDEYNQIPARMLAGYFHDALWRLDLEKRPFPDVVTMAYILRGRSNLEVKQIEFQFNEMYHYLRTGVGEPTLRDQIDEMLEGTSHAQIIELLEGFNSSNAAAKIHHLLKNCAEVGELNEEGDDLAQDFAGVFRRDYSKFPTWERELRARDAIETETKFLSPEQFVELRKSLKDTYGEDLTPALYTCNLPKDPRKIALDLYKALFNVEPRILKNRDDDYLSQEELFHVKDEFRLSNNREIRDIIRYHANEIKAKDSLRRIRMALVPLEYLDMDMMYEVKQEFIATAGIELVEFVNGSVDEICRNDVPAYVKSLLQYRLSGLLRSPLRADLFELFATEEQRIERGLSLRHKKEVLQEAEKLSEEFEAAFEADTDYSKKAANIIQILRGKNHETLMELEKIYFERSEEKKPLIRALEEQFDGDEFQEMNALLNDFDPEFYAERIHRSLRNLSGLVHAPAEVIILTMKRYRKKFGLDILAMVKQEYTGQEHARGLALALSILFTPDALDMKAILSAEDPLDEKELKEFIRHLARPRMEILAYEAAYNRHYSKFEYCFERHYGSLLLRLRVLATKKILPRPYFSEAILLLEGINPTITAELHAYLSPLEISGVDLLAAQQILRENKYDLNTIKKSYNALNASETLRETVYNLKIPLVGINKTLLLLDGFDPDALATDLHEVIEKYEGQELGTEVLKLMAIPKPGHPNPRIPRHVNWTGEMYHQIRIAFESLYGKKLISELIRKKVPFKEKGINAIAYKLYGEVALSVVDVYRMAHVQLTSPEEDQDKVSRRLVHSLKILIPALRERLIDMYDAYFAIQPGHLPLRNQLLTHIKDEKLKKLLLKLLDEVHEWEIQGGSDGESGHEESEESEAPEPVLRG